MGRRTRPDENYELSQETMSELKLSSSSSTAASRFVVGFPVYFHSSDHSTQVDLTVDIDL